jgi:hypothetical protein
VIGFVPFEGICVAVEALMMTADLADTATSSLVMFDLGVMGAWAMLFCFCLECILDEVIPGATGDATVVVNKD